MFWQIGVHPNLHLSFLREEDHFFSNIEISDLFIEYFEPLETALVEIELIVQRDVIDFLQPQLNLANIEEAVVNGRTEFIHRGVCEILDLVNIGTGTIGLHLLITQDLYFPLIALLLPQLDVLSVATEVLLIQKLKLVFLYQLIGDFVDQ